MTDPILQSPKLTALLEDRDKLKAKAEQSRTAVRRMTQIMSPQFQDATVRTVTDEWGEAARKQAVVFTGIDEQDETARKKDALERTLKGEPLADSTGMKEQLEKEHRQWSAFEDAIEFRTREIEREKTVLAIAYSKTMKPTHDDIMRKLSNSILATHAAWLELFNLKQHLVESEVGLRGLCLIRPDFLGVPVGPYSDMADFLHAAKREGYIKEVPKEMRL